MYRVSWPNVLTPTGTGKTTTARKLGSIFYHLGFLGSDSVIECSATDLIGEYVGQTGPKVVNKFDEALGKVLFVDEAYRLGEGTFAKEAVDEVVDCLTKDRYRGKMLVVFAGYEEEINRLLQINPGLTSRFAEDVMFEHFTPTQCVDLLVKRLQRYKKLEASLEPVSPHRVGVEDYFLRLSQTPGWANGRDIESLAARIISDFLRSSTDISDSEGVTWHDVIPQLSRLLAERERRASNITTQSVGAALPTRQQSSTFTKQLPVRSINAATESSETPEPSPAAPLATHVDPTSTSSTTVRDPDVMEEVWQQLCADIVKKRHEETAQDCAIDELRARQGRTMDVAQEQMAKVEAMQKETVDSAAARQLWEAARLEALAQKRKAAEEARRLENLEQARRQVREREEKAQQRLRHMGVCVAGYRWNQQSDGYRCAGGSHFVSNAQLGL